MTPPVTIAPPPVLPPARATPAPPASPPDFATLALRVDALSGHELGPLLRDQLQILQRIEEDPPGLFAADDPLGEWNDALTTWERGHLRACLDEWLDVLENNTLLAATLDSPRPRLDVRDFGATGDGETDDAPALRRALAALAALERPATLVFPAGRYRLISQEEPANHLVVRGLRNAILEGEPGAELLGQAPATILRFASCHNIRVRRLVCDYAPAIAAEGRVAHVNLSENSVLWRADADASAPAALCHGQPTVSAAVFTADGVLRPAQHGLRAVSWDLLEPGLWRLQLAGATLADLVAGDRLVLFRRFKWSQALVVSECAWIDLHEISIHSAPEFALFIESSTGVSVRHCRLTPRPGRLGGLNADGIHARSNRYGPFFVDCEIRGVQDDCFNLQSRMVSVVETIDPRTVVLDLPWDAAERLGYWHPARGDFRGGDMLAFLDPSTGELVGWARIVRVAARAWRGHRRLVATLDQSVAGLASRESLGKTRPVLSSSEYLGVTADTPIEHFVVNASTKNDGFVIRGCAFGNNSVTGGKIKSGNGLIVGNRSSRHGWCVWSFATEILWQEGYAARRVLVQGNHHDNWFGVFMGSQLPLGRLHVGAPLHYRVDILDNTFAGHASGEFALDLNGVVGCVVAGNHFPPDRPVVVGPTCRHVRLDRNTHDLPRGPRA
jgi:hypothetical protein